MVKIISSFNSSIPSVRKVKNWLQTEPYHIWHGRDRLVLFFILAGDEAATAFIPLEEKDYSEVDEGLRMILESTHNEELEKEIIISRYISSLMRFLILWMISISNFLLFLCKTSQMTILKFQKTFVTSMKN